MPARKRSIAAAALALAAVLVAGCSLFGPSQPAFVTELATLPVGATSVEVKFLEGNALGEIPAWWEVHYTTDRPKETVDAVRHLFTPIGLPVDDSNTGFGFTILDEVDVHENFTTDEATTKIVVRFRPELLGDDGKLKGGASGGSRPDGSQRAAASRPTTGGSASATVAPTRTAITSGSV